jgi:hypothetical protein
MLADLRLGTRDPRGRLAIHLAASRNQREQNGDRQNESQISSSRPSRQSPAELERPMMPGAIRGADPACSPHDLRELVAMLSLQCRH